MRRLDSLNRYEAFRPWEWWRQRARSLWFFEKVILAESWRDRYADFGQIQHDMCDHIQDESYLQKYLSAYRGSFKSTVLQGFFSYTFCWARAENRADGMIYNTATKDNAQIFQSGVKHDLLENDLLKWVFPEIPRREKDYRKMTMQRIEANDVVLDFASTETILVSRHFPKWCICEGSLVYTSNGLVPIEDVEKSMRVYNQHGVHTEVLNLVERVPKNQVIEISVIGNPEKIRVTEDHRILIYSENKLDWKEAGKIKKNDYMAIAIPSGLTRAISRVNKRINKILSVKDFWRFLGYWLAEGCATPDKNRVRLSFGKKELDYANDVKSILEKFGIKVNINETKTSLMVDFFDSDVKEILEKFGTHAWNKHIPPFIMSNFECLQRELILGYFRGDGSKIKGPNGWEYRGWNASSVSRSLLAGIQLLLAKSNIPSSISKVSNGGRQMVAGRVANTKPSWVLSASSPLIDLIMGSSTSFPTKPNLIKFIPGYILFPVKKARNINYDGRVYDIEVNKGESFTIAGGCVHNCNDDLENDKNTATEPAREKLKRDWQYQKAITTKIPGKSLALEIETGTPYHFDGLIWDIKSNPRYTALEIPCWRDIEDADGKKSRVLTFPEFHSFEYFENKRAQMTPGIFAAQYLLQPIDEEEALCRSAWMKHWLEKDLPVNRYRIMIIDAGGSDPTVSDATAVTVVDHDALGNMYIISAKEFFLTPMELMDWIPRWKSEFTPDETRIEKERASTTIADLFKHRFAQMGIFYVEHRNRSKTSRIWRLRQYFESKKILFGPNMEELELQALRWKGEGSLKRDDLLDSLAYHLDVKKPPTVALPHRLPSGRIFEPKTNRQFDEEIEKIMRIASQREVNYQEYCDANY